VPERVCAVVLTFNRKALLLECLRSVLGQTVPVERVLLVDNASSDGTPELLAEEGLLADPRVEYVRLERNLGGAGGFSHGVARARELPCDWLWLMDDDAEPRPDALERLLGSPAAADPRVAGVCGAVVDPHGTIEARVHRGHFRRRMTPLPREAYANGAEPEIDYCSFVGPLFRASAVRAIAPPKAEFFIWGDDLEYCLRLREHGAIRVVPESVIVHKEVGQTHTNARARFWNRVLGQDIVPFPLKDFWKQLFGLRNYVWIKMTYTDQGPVSAAGTIAQFMAKSLMYEERPLRRLPWIVRYGIDGRRGRFVNVDPREWMAKVS
jgi:rhamnopyranosyl-N-acetylglucosaminyl-diphospho-decaprenol beta-1,3/1,4-galactofuranosyltransferase